MEIRKLGGSGTSWCRLLRLGTGTFGGGGDFFKAWGTSGVEEADAARRHLPRGRAQHVRHGRHLFGGLAEEILGRAIKGRRDRVLISTKGDVPHRARAERCRLVAPSPDRGRARRACGGWAPTTSTSSSCTASTR